MKPMHDSVSSKEQLAVIGNIDLVQGFKALGFTVHAVKDAAEAKAVLQEIIPRGVCVCLVQEDIYQAIADQLQQYRPLPLPVFLPLGQTAATSVLDEDVSRVRLRATGTISRTEQKT